MLNEANLTNAVLARSVLTRSDLGGAIIEGADFSDAVLDLPQKQVLALRICHGRASYTSKFINLVLLNYNHICRHFASMRTGQIQ